MNKFLDKFGLFDIFSMLIPGIFFMTFLLYLYPDVKKMAELNYSSDASKVFLFFVLSYFSGIIFHEVWRILDWVATKFFGKKEIREQFLMPDKNIIRNKLDFALAEVVKKSIIKDNKLEKINAEETEKNKFVFNYCMNALEIEGMAGKKEKMQVISEMSASLFLESLVLAFMYIILIYNGKITINIANIVILLLSIIIFWERKNRYARYRVDNLIRTYYIATKRGRL